MVIKSDITNTSGIGIKPLQTECLNLVSAKSMIPETLYWLLRWIISTDDSDKNGEYPNECKNKADERKVLMVAQNILHCSSHARIKTPKHTCLAMAVRHLTSSKEMITLLN